MDVRRAALDFLGELKVGALDAGDVGFATMLHRWEGELLGQAGADGDAAPVIDLAARKRGGS